MTNSTAERLTPEEQRIAREKHAARALQKARIDAGLSERECAAAIGVSVALWRGYESEEDRSTLKSSDIARLPETVLIPYMRELLRLTSLAVAHLPQDTALPSESIAMIAATVKETSDVVVAHATAVREGTLSAYEDVVTETTEMLEAGVSLRARAEAEVARIRALAPSPLKRAR